MFNSVSLQYSTRYRENWSHCVVSCFTIMLYYLKKIAKFQRTIITEFFCLFQLIASPLSPPCHFKKSWTFRCLFSTSSENPHLCLPYRLHSISGLLSPPVFSLKSGHSTGDLPWGRQKRAMRVLLVLSRVNLLSCTFMSYWTISQGHILLSTCILSKIKENLIHQNMPWGLHLTKANLVNVLDSPFLCQRIKVQLKSIWKTSYIPSDI